MDVTCSVCDKIKPVKEFYTTTVKGKVYRRRQCKNCYRLRNNLQNLRRYHEETKQWLSWKKRF